MSDGYRRVHVLLRREGWPINVKRVHRLYREEVLCLRAKRPKQRRSAVARIERSAGAVPNERGLPAVITLDNGTECTSRALDHWPTKTS